MDMGLTSWMVGMVFLLGVFAWKTGIGLFYAKAEPALVTTTLAGYLALFAAVSYFSKELIGMLPRVLLDGLYLHIAFAAAMVLWGTYCVSRKNGPERTGDTVGTKAPLGAILPFVLPCPVLLTAILCSLSAVGSLVPIRPLFLGLLLGGAFGTAFLAALFVFRRKKEGRPVPATGLIMWFLALYFALATVIPPKIEEAKVMYASFVGDRPGIDGRDLSGVFGVLLAVLLLGYGAGARRKEVEQ